MKLNTIISGADSALPPVLLVHGLFGSAKNLGGLARRLDPTRKVISVDMRNHGDSAHDADHSYAALAGDLAQVIEAHGGVVDIVGHSMGGKAAMVLALTRPALIRRLVVLDIAPIAYGHSQQRYVDAMLGLDLAGVKLRSEADRRLAETVDEIAATGRRAVPPTPTPASTARPLRSAITLRPGLAIEPLKVMMPRSMLSRCP